MLKIKNGYYLELLMIEPMKLLDNTENEKTKDKKGENIPHLEITEVILVHCNMINTSYQQDSRVLYTVFPNKPFDNLLEIAQTSFIPLKTFNSEFLYIKKNIQPLEIEDRLQPLNDIAIIKIRDSKVIELKGQMYVKVYGFLSLAKSIGSNVSGK